ncbi:MAG TPA: protein kinase [Polyangiaceae bacterium]|nr:protein kinase [Polyangiaceae bacterium]
MKSQLRSTSEATPKRIGRYDTFLQLGAGRLACVYLAAQNDQAGQSQLVVVKVLRREAVEDEHVLALFKDEARIATRLQHPNIVRTREVIAEPPDYLLATDYQAGHSLLEVLRRLGRQAVPVDEHIYILTKVLAGLSYAHELKDESGKPFGIVHRDVSPANVLVSYTGDVKLIDFGIARASGAVVATQDGVVTGKVGYAAPEQCLGEPTDARSDIYSVGVMLWEAIAMRPRSSGETWQSIHQARLDDAEPELEAVCPNTPPALLAIVRKALARDPSDRYAKAREFQRDLEKYLGGKPGPKVGPARVAALLKPHFDRDRARRQKEIHAFVSTLRGSAAASPRRVLGAAPPDRTAQPTNGVQLPPPAAVAKPMQLPVAETSKPIATPPALPVAHKSIAGPPPLPPATKLGAGPPPLPSVRKATSPPPLPTASVSLAGSAANSTVPRAVNALGRVTGMMPSVGLNPVVTVSNIPPPPRKTRAGLALVIFGAALCLGGFIASTLHKSGQQAVAPLPTAETSQPAAQKPRAPQVETVRVRISVDPPEAVVRLDGRVLDGNPFTASLPKDNAVHELIASAKGCRDAKQVIHLNQNVDVLVALKRLWNYMPPRGRNRSNP